MSQRKVTPMTTPQYTTKDIERFWSKVDKSAGENACWKYTGYIRADGYGNFWFQGATHMAHRIAYILTYGSILDGLSVCHTCDNRRCCNPKHLWLGTTLDNLTDMRKKGRNALQYGESNPYCKLTNEQVIEIRKRYIPRVVTCQQLANEFNVSLSCISYIVRYMSRIRG
jgi:hypothetical protein